MPLFSTDKFQIEIERNWKNIYNISETVIPPDEREVAAMIDQIMEYNKKFVENKGYEPFLTSKYPDKKLAILTCMDTRLIELLPAALGIKNGDAKIIKNAGGTMVHPYGSVVRSLLVGILGLGGEEVRVIGHTDCGVQGMDGKEVLEQLILVEQDVQHLL